MYGGHLSILINDPSIKDAEFTKMKLLDATLITEEGKEVNLGRPFYTGYGVGVTYAFDLTKLGITEDKFKLRVTTSLDGKMTTITGTFSVNGHFEIMDFEKDLDPGGKR